MAVSKHELFQGKDGQLYIVKATTLGEYSLISVKLTHVRRFRRKHEAVRHIMSGLNNADA